MNSPIYNIPADLAQAYTGRQIIVRSPDPGSIVRKLPDNQTDNVRFIQLTSTHIDPDDIRPLANWGRGIPVDIVVSDPAADFPLLYNFSQLIDKHPIRVSIAVKPGFSKAVKLALALRFAVKLEVGQPDTGLIEEMSEVLDLYLHDSKVSQPVEYFHSMFLASFRNETARLWIVQEDDPDRFRYVTDDGVEQISARFAGTDPSYDFDDSASADPSADTLAEAECDSCEFFSFCGGYFKWPDRSYECAGVRFIFRTIDAAAAELKENIAELAASQGDTTYDA